jgi:phage protein D
MLMSTGVRPRVAVSRPRIAVDGTDKATLSQGLLALRVHEAVDGLASCEATFGNWGTRDNQVSFLYFDRRLLDFGRELAVAIGDGVLFRGRISGVEAVFPEGEQPRITVLAEDRYQDLRMVRRTRTFSDVTDADVFRQVATDHGLRPDVRLPEVTHRLLAQLNQSDLAFLRDRARALDAELWMDGTTLLARPRTDRPGATLHLGYGNELRDFVVLADLAGQRSSITVGGWDVAGKQALKETADESAITGELDGGRSGSGVLASALGERKDTLAHSVPVTSSEARARAEAAYRCVARRFLTGRGVADTSPGLRVGAKVTLDHLGELFSGTYYVTEVTHLFDDELGLRTEFATERTGLGGQS